MPSFAHYDLRLLNPTFSSPLLDVLTDLDYLRRHQMTGSTPVPVFLQLKRVFHLLESLASARIEGNHTTLADYVESRVDRAEQRTEQLREIDNIEQAMRQLEESVEPGSAITEMLLRSLHGTAVEGLNREGDRTPGAYRSGPVKIAQAEHLPPPHLDVPAYMEELVAFINRDDPPKYALMKVALAHHRFAWIHPFSNGNGRVVRLLTYALLLKYGFQVSVARGEAGRLLNPAAVFCADRSRYYEMLGGADAGTDEGLEAWCAYALGGVRDEMNKVIQLADYTYLAGKILLPALAHAKERQFITEQEAAILMATVKAGEVKSLGIAKAVPKLSPNQRTYAIGKLVESGMLQPRAEGARYYTLGFSANKLLRSIVHVLTQQGFIPPALASG